MKAARKRLKLEMSFHSLGELFPHVNFYLNIRNMMKRLPVGADKKNYPTMKVA